MLDPNALNVLPDLIQMFSAIKENYPLLLPDENEPLTDDLIISLYCELLRASCASEIWNSGVFDYYAFDYSSKIELLQSDSISSAEKYSLLCELMGEFGSEIFSRLEIPTTIYSYDHLDNDLHAGYCPFPLILFGEAIDPNFRTQSEHPDMDALAYSISPFLGKYSAAILKWRSFSQVDQGVNAFPLIPYFILFFSVPGLTLNAFFGAAEKGDLWTSSVPWKDVPEVRRELSLLNKLSSRSDKPLPTASFLKECLRTFEIVVPK